MDELSLMTVRKVAEIFDVTPYTIREWIKENKLPATKVGKSWRVREADVRALVNDKYGSGTRA